MSAKQMSFPLSGELAMHLRSPESFRHQLRCEWCDAVYGSDRSHSKTCSRQCKQALYRSRKAMRALNSGG